MDLHDTEIQAANRPRPGNFIALRHAAFFLSPCGLVAPWALTSSNRPSTSGLSPGTEIMFLVLRYPASVVESTNSPDDSEEPREDSRRRKNGH